MKLLLADDVSMEWIARHLDPEWLQHSAARSLVEKRLESFYQQSWEGVAALVNACPDDATRRLLTEAALQDKAVDDAERSLHEIVLRLRNQYFDRQLATLRQRVAQPGLTGDQQEALLREQSELRQWKLRPLQPRSGQEIGEA